MQHFADFGVIKQQNKQLKRNAQLGKADEIYTKKYGKGVEDTLNEKLKPFGSQTKPANTLRVARESLKPYSFDTRDGGNTLLKDEWYNDRGGNRTRLRKEAGLPQLMRKPKGYEYKDLYAPDPLKRDYVKTPDTKGFTDIRKTTDEAASPTGYLGFRTDSYKGMGGMMEEPVDMVSTGVRMPKARIRY